MSIKYPIFHTGKGHLMFFHGWEPKKTQNGKELFSTTFIFPKRILQAMSATSKHFVKPTTSQSRPKIAMTGLLLIR